VNVFEEVRVVELGGGPAVSLAGLIFADFGADVVKVEPPRGDFARGSRGFEMWNRGKDSVVLDLASAEGRDAAYELLAVADVVLDGMGLGAAERFGLGYADLADMNRALVYGTVSGFGRPSRTKGYESLVAAKIGQWVGLDEVQGRARGRRADLPLFKVTPVASFAAAQLLFQGVAAALLRRRETGAGEHVSTSLAQGAMSLIMRRELSPDQDKGARHADDLIMRGIHLTFLNVECADGKWIQMCARQDHHFRNWLLAIEMDDAVADPRYANGPLRIPTLEDADELEERIRARMRRRAQAEWMDIFVKDYDIGGDPVLTPAEFLEHEQLRANDLVVEFEHPELGTIRQLGPLAKLSETPAVPPRPAPRLDQRAAAPSWPPRAQSPNGRSGGGKATERLPLEGVTIVEMAYFVAAPLGPAILAELGARVIKVEPKEGDPWRRVGLASLPFMHGKESVAVDLKSPEGREILDRLIGAADVLLTSFRPGVPDRLGFGYEEAASINPRLVYVHATSYGTKGPHARRAAFHSTPTALTGAAIHQAGRGNPPADDGFPDPCGGLGVGTAIVLGLSARDGTGRGQYIETNMLVSAGYAFSDSLVEFEHAPARVINDGAQLGISALQRIYECAEGHLVVSVVRDDEWGALAGALGDAELALDPRFATGRLRTEHDDELTSRLSAVLRAKPARAWETELGSRGVPVAEVNEAGIRQGLLDAGFLLPADHPAFGDYWRVGGRVNLAGAETRLAPASAIGEHTETILVELGFGAADVEAMIETGAVAVDELSRRRLTT
jgi:crotonobetainyl-CoA:carnitine CoA-transferase CaiB-like acyl-CoA transferase